MLDSGSGVAGGARGWIAGRAGLWGVTVPPSWVWVVGLRPQILEHPNSISGTAVNNIYKLHERMKNFDPSHTCLPCFMGMMEHFFGFNSKLMSLIAA